MQERTEELWYCLNWYSFGFISNILQLKKFYSQGMRFINGISLKMFKAKLNYWMLKMILSFLKIY